jgi:hypothetical protein
MLDGIVYKFNLGDVEDPVIYAAQPIAQWEQSEMGKWVKTNSNIVPIWNISRSFSSFGYSVYIVANLSPENWTYFHLKFKQFDYEHI